MSSRIKKFFVSFLICITLFNFFQKEISYAQVYYNNYSVNKTFPSSMVIANERAIPLAIPLISEYAVPAVLNIVAVCVLGIAIHDNSQITNDYVQQLLTGIQANGDSPGVVDYVKEKIQGLHPATVGYLVMAGAGADNAKVEEEMEDAGWNPQFIKEVKEELTGGGGGNGSSGKNPKGKITMAGIKKFGALALMTVSFIGGLFTLLKNTVSGGEQDLTFGKIFGGLGTKYRMIPLLAGESGKTTGTGTFNMKYGKDLNMDLVQQVYIKMGRVKLYNYGWDGVVYRQEYKLKSINGGKEFLFLVFIGKALSPNQYIDTEWDGLTYGFYELDEFGNIVKNSIHNMYNNYLDVERLEMANSTVPKLGTSLAKITSNGDYTGFAYMRNKIKSALGADLFPALPADYNFMVEGKYSPNVDLFCDFSKGLSGTYNNLWQSINGEPVLKDFAQDGNYTVAFPNSGINAGKDFFSSNYPPGTCILTSTSGNVGQTIKDKLDNKGEVYKEGSSSVSIDTKVDSPSGTDLDKAFPNVGDVTIPKPDSGTDSKPDSKPDDGTGTGTVEGELAPPFSPPSIKVPEFNPIDLNFEPLKLNLADMTEKFPFSLPWDFHRLVTGLGGAVARSNRSIRRSAENAPLFEIELLNTKFELDFTPFVPIMGIIKFFVGISFVVILMLITKKLTQG